MISQTSRIINPRFCFMTINIIMLNGSYHLSHSFWTVFYGAVEFFWVAQNVAVELVRFWNTFSKCLVIRREQTCGWQGGEQGGMDWEFGISRCKLLYIEWIDNKVLLYSTGNYFQYLVINHDGKEYEKKNVHKLHTIKHVINQ